VFARARDVLCLIISLSLSLFSVLHVF
jgi:hypothetical protein